MEIASIPGEYYLQGVRETSSGFLLNPDGTFQFFFSYGALDRYGSGKWAITDDQLVLNGLAKPLHDFALVESNRVDDQNVTIRIKDNNPSLPKYVYASLQKGDEGSWLPATNEGIVRFPKQEVESISLLFEFCPERFSVFTIGEKDHNDFIFRFEPWIVEVFLVDFRLQIDEDGLVGQHPLMEGVDYRYQKQ